MEFYMFNLYAAYNTIKLLSEYQDFDTIMVFSYFRKFVEDPSKVEMFNA